MSNCTNHEFYFMDNGCMPLRNKSMTLMRFYGFPHHGYRFFASVQDDVLWSSLPWVQILHVRLWWRLTFPSLWRVFPKSSFWTGVRMLCEKAGKRDGEMEWRIYYPDDILRLSSPRQQILRFRSGWRLNVLYKDHRAGRQKELLAHVVRLRILACRNG